MKRILALLLTLVLLTGCGNSSGTMTQKQYQATFLELFDTVTTVVGYAESEEEFRRISEEIRDRLQEYHQLFTIYEDYEGINNIKTINDQAGTAPVKVDPRIIEFLLDCRSYYEKTEGRVNVAMGSVLSLWHEARSESIENPEYAYLPKEEELKEGALHIGFDTIIIDEKEQTVFITDPKQSLDVGAIAKGWSVQKVCEQAPEGLLISVGGNVQATGPKPIGSWVVGVQDPSAPDEFLHTLYIGKGCVVSSGDYQRYYQVEGKNYHHIIDPDTLYPAQRWRMVTIVCEDSGLADFLSTALFLLPRKEGEALAEEFGAHALWMDKEGNRYYSSGFEELIRT